LNAHSSAAALEAGKLSVHAASYYSTDQATSSVQNIEIFLCMLPTALPYQIFILASRFMHLSLQDSVWQCGKSCGKSSIHPIIIDIMFRYRY